ncbi:MAG: VOC family protein [Gammaproteobacteria bacterium]|nr:MAG: VOC family protein [Gammaproteobacteria bacterium]
MTIPTEKILRLAPESVDSLFPPFPWGCLLDLMHRNIPAGEGNSTPHSLGSRHVRQQPQRTTSSRRCADSDRVARRTRRAARHEQSRDRRTPRHQGTSALRLQERPNMTTLTLGPLAQIARTVRDIKESEAWYRTLGLPHLYSFGSLAFFDCGGTRLMLSAQEKPAPESILYLRVEDIRTAYELLRSRGIEFMDAPHLIHRHADGTEEWMAHFQDAEGRPLAIMSQVRP